MNHLCEHSYFACSLVSRTLNRRRNSEFTTDYNKKEPVFQKYEICTRYLSLSTILSSGLDKKFPEKVFSEFPWSVDILSMFTHSLLLEMMGFFAMYFFNSQYTSSLLTLCRFFQLLRQCRQHHILQTESRTWKTCMELLRKLGRVKRENKKVSI